MKLMNKLWAKVLTNSSHGHGHNFTPRKANVFYSLVDVTVLPKLSQVAPGASVAFTS